MQKLSALRAVAPILFRNPWIAVAGVREHMKRLLSSPASEHEPEKKARKQRPFAVFGLGNPGTGFDGTRHNIGFACADALRQRFQADCPYKEKFQCLFTQHEVSGETVIVAKPQTFMNNSGRAVLSLVKNFSVLHERVFVIQDDLDLPLGVLRIRNKGSAGGQNGVADIIKCLGAKSKFVRIKVGIGRPAGNSDPIKHVLKRFQAEEAELVKTRILPRVVECVESMIGGLSVEQAMMRFNKHCDDMDKEDARIAQKAAERATRLQKKKDQDTTQPKQAQDITLDCVGSQAQGVACSSP